MPRPSEADRHRRDVAGRLEPLLRRLESRDGRDRPFALAFWDGSELAATTPEPGFRLLVRSPDALAHVARRPGELGLARAWVSGALDVDGDLEATLALLYERVAAVRPRARDWAAVVAAAWRTGTRVLPTRPATEAHLRGRMHSRTRDRSAVRHHYDLPTAFYRLVLGPSLVYSEARFEEPAETLEVAQERELEHICRTLELRPGERLLDVGCGWGGLVLHAAKRFGAEATGITLSPSQAAEARRRVAEAGVRERCTVEVTDVRELAAGRFDAVASVGMYEHVGRAGLRRYAERLAGFLRPGGRLFHSGITRVNGTPNRATFIGRYVFPDGELHPVAELLAALEAAGFELRLVDGLREQYAATLRRWVANLERHKEEATRLVGVERVRVWRLYMGAAALAFDRGDLGLHHVVAVRRSAGVRPQLRSGRWTSASTASEPDRHMESDSRDEVLSSSRGGTPARSPLAYGHRLLRDLDAVRVGRASRRQRTFQRRNDQKAISGQPGDTGSHRR